MNKRIALINPPSPFLINERVTPNTGILGVATEMKKGGLDVQVFDFCGDVDYKGAMEEISREGFGVYGFSTTSAQFSYTHELLQILRRINPGALAIVGGAHASAMASLRDRMGAEERANDPNIRALEEFDLIFAGEGEQVPDQLFKPGQKWRTMPLIKDLGSVSIPDRGFFDIKSYHYTIGGLESTSLLTQRGCPFKCKFCCGRNIDTYKKLRFFSPQRVLEELDYLNGEFGFEAFMWQDEEINLSPSRVFELSRLLQKRHYTHRGMVRPDLVTNHPETLGALVDAGFVELCGGIESGSNRILKEIDKGTTAEMNLRAAEMIRGAGMTFKAFLMLGLPSETYEDIELTKKWLLQAKPDSFDLAILQPYPGSIIYDEATTSTRFEGYEVEYDGKLFFNRLDFSKSPSFYKGIPGQYKCSVRTGDLSAEDLVGIRDRLEEEVRQTLYNQENKK